ncbi:MAG TPA: FG-GAP-like repeat-containing protein [Humisphaera sp.]|jgi:hypothetical protein|nr:FG-GAP-like repeat-containing protein [Humisphaera sp.]
MLSATLSISQLPAPADVVQNPSVQALSIGTPDLDPDFDTGLSNTDNITNLNNSSSNKALQFEMVVSGIATGTVCSLFADGVLIASGGTGGPGVIGVGLKTDGKRVFSDGVHVFTARLSNPDGTQSPDSPPLSVTIDTTPPATPPAPVLESQSDTGISDSDHITSDVTPAFDVVATDPGMIQLTTNGQNLGPQATVSSAGMYTLSSWYATTTFTKGSTFIGPFGTTVDTCDLNGDSLPDLIINNGQVVVEAINNGDGSFTRSTVPNIQVNDMKAGDFNGDGTVDIVGMPSSNPASVVLYVGNGDGTFQAPKTLYTALTIIPTVDAADLNHDGHLDVVVAASELATLMGNGDGTFQPALVQQFTFSAGTGVFLADVNGDGTADVIISDIGGLAVLLMHPNGLEQWPPSFTLGDKSITGFGSVAVADLNSDGKPDLIADTSNGIFVCMGHGDGTFTSPTLFASPISLRGLTIADFDRDGVSDALATGVGPTGNDLVFFHGDGNGTFEPPVLSAATERGGPMTVGDFNHDGRVDVLINGNATELGAGGPLMDGVYSIAAWAQDVAGNRSAPSPATSIAVTTVRPTAQLSASTYHVDEGSSVDLSVAKASASAISYQWDFDYDGTTFSPSESGQNVEFDASAIDGPTTRTVAMRVSDIAGNASLLTATVVIQNVAPTASFVGGVYGLGFPGKVIFDSPVDPSAADAASGYTYSYDFDNDGVFDLTDCSSSTAIVPADDLASLGEHIIRGRISDKDGGFTDYLATITIAQPAVLRGTVFGDNNTNGTRDAGEIGVSGITVYLDANGNGQLDPQETSVLTVADGDYLFPAVQLSTPFQLHAILPAGWTITGGDGADGTMLTLGPDSVVTGLDFGVKSPPLPSFGGPYSTSEGSQVILDASGSSELGGTIAQYEWDTDYDGSTFVTRASGATILFSAAGLDGPSTRAVALRVTDENGVAEIVSGSVMINNAPPTAVFLAGAPVPLGSAGRVAFFRSSDPSPADVAAGFKYSFDFNNVGTFEIADSPAAVATIPASFLTATGVHKIRGRIEDKDGGFTDYTTTVYAYKPAPAAISGTLFNDANSNGVLDKGEKPLVSRVVFIDTNKNGKPDAGEITTTTKTNGTYSFKNLLPGSYRIADVLPARWRRTNPVIGYYDLNLRAGQSVTGRNFAETQNVLVTGVVFNDLNGNGKQDSGETGIAGMTVYIDRNKNGKLNPGEASTITAADGSYNFKTLVAGSYRVAQVLPTGWRVINPTSGYLDLTLATGQSATDETFADITAAITGKILQK